MKKLEFSKLILITIYITAIIFTAITVIMTMNGFETGNFSPIVLAIWAELGTSSGFYYWKAKAENKIKLLKDVPQDLADEAKDLLDNE